MSFKTAFEIVKTTAGETSIKDLITGEIMHNPVGPWKEARALYVEQSRLKKRLLNGIETPLILFDVGMGATFNTLAAIEAFYETSQNSQSRDLHITSFENNLKLFEYVLENLEHFPESDRFKDLLLELKENHSLEKTIHKRKLSWILKEGDFRKTLTPDLKKAEIVFYDPYSPKVNGEMWTYECFKELKPYVDGLLLTYSIATSVRTALLLAGFFVGEGDSSGKKEKTTVASTQIETLSWPLDLRWFERWERSHTPMPLGNLQLNLEEIENALRSHPQFAARFPLQK